MFIYVVFLLALSSASSSLPLSGSKSVSDVVYTKESFEQKFPELVLWYQRAADRVRHNATASAEDLNEIREALKTGKQKVYEFVSSPLYDIFGSMVIERTVNVASPLLGIFPLKEFRELMKIVNKKPDLLKLIFAEPEEADSITKLLPNAAYFDQWLTNSTKKLVDEVVDSATAIDGDEEDFGLLRSGSEGAPGAPGALEGTAGAPGAISDDAPGAPGAPAGAPAAPGAPGGR